MGSFTGIKSKGMELFLRFVIIFLLSVLASHHGVDCNNSNSNDIAADTNNNYYGSTSNTRESRHYETVDTIVIEGPKLAHPEPDDSKPEGHKKYPHLVSIMRDGKQICAGALLDELHVISTAHCVPNMTSEEVTKLQIGIGYQTFGEGASDELKNREGPYYVRRVTKVIMDRSYFYQTLTTRNSLVLFQFDAPVAFNDFVEALDLPTPNINITTKFSRPLPPIKSGKLAGWRKGFDTAGKEAFYLKAVTLRVHPYEECRKEYLNSNKMDDIFCASTALSNSCQYALGSPFTNKRQGRAVLIGLRERNCHFPNVFTKVEYFLPWIKKNLKHK